MTTTTDTTTTAVGEVLDLRPATIRLWARSNDLDVSPKGKIPDTITAAYFKAHGHAATPRPKPAPPAPRPAVSLEERDTRVERLRAEVASFRDQNAAHESDRAEWSAKVSEMRDRQAAVEEQRDQARVEANGLAVELARLAELVPPTVVATLPGPLPDEILELLAAWHALFAKATEVDTAAGHTLAEVALPALVREVADQAHDLVRLLDGDTSR